jgi:hypothetical protein
MRCLPLVFSSSYVRSSKDGVSPSCAASREVASRVDLGVISLPSHHVRSSSCALIVSLSLTMTAHHILVGSYTDQITTLVFTEGADGAAPKLEHKSAVSIGHHPSWLTIHPTASSKQKSVVFTGVEQSEGMIVALEFDAEGKGKVVGQTTAGGRDPCTLEASKDGKELIVGNVRASCLRSIVWAYDQVVFVRPHRHYSPHHHCTVPPHQRRVVPYGRDDRYRSARRQTRGLAPASCILLHTRAG